MRSRAGLLAGLALLASGVLSDSRAAAQGFNPQGRQRPKGAQPTKPPAAPQTKPPEGERRAPRVSGEAPVNKPVSETGAAAGAENQSTEALIARYTAIVLDQPGEEFPLERLIALYRTRDGKLDGLVSDFERRAQAGGAAAQNAKIALGGIYATAGQPERAAAVYTEVVTAEPKHAVALMRLASLLASQGNKAEARRRMEQALGLPGPEARREQGLRLLLGWALDDGDVGAAKRAHGRLVQLSHDSFFVRAELGRELFTRGRYAEAEQEYRELVKLARGDNRTLAPALKDLGQALMQQGKYAEAEKALGEAEAAAGAQSGLRQEILEAIVQVYRATDKLPALIAKLEAQKDQQSERLLLLAALYEETGRVAEAQKAYERALRADPKSVAARLKVIQLLELAGELDAVVQHYEQLIRAAPRDSQYVFRLAEAELARGNRRAALAVLDRLSAEPQLDEGTLSALVAFYERLGEGQRALALLEQLAKSGDERHLIELGDRYYAAGDQERALKTWQRITGGRSADTSQALHALGEVYLEHDMPERALEALKRASELSPNEVKYKKSYALALERSGAASASREQRSQLYGEAQRLWDQLLERAQKTRDTNLAREARQHIVTLWGLTGTLEQRTGALLRRLEQKPPDLEAGRILGEAYLRLGRYRDAERALRRVLEAAPADIDSHLRLERALVQSGRLADAIKVLEAAAALDLAHAREYYQRMGRYAAELYEDERAIEYTRRAVELSPDDADGHFRLGEMYRRRQDTEQAIAEFRRALSKNDRLFAVHFQLAELLLNRQEIEEADQLLRKVLRSAPDEQLIQNAARLSIQIHLGRGTLEALEKDLLPLALSNPSRPVYRRLLVELYGSLAFPLANEAASTDPAVRARARGALEKLGQRAVGPLLAALGDNQDTQQRVAIELLSHIQNRNAGPALLAFAAGEADSELRVRAVIAAGALRDPELYERLAKFVEPGASSETDPVSVAAAWAVAELGSPKARALLLERVNDNAPTLGALAVLGLVKLGNRQDARLFADVVHSPEQGPLTRAAAAYALGEFGGAPAATARRLDLDLGSLAQASDVVVRGTATLALARLKLPNAGRAIADALFSRDPELVESAVSAAALLVSGEYKRPASEPEVPQGRVDVRQMLASRAPRGYTPDDEARALVRLAPEISAAALSAIQASPEQARAVADLLLTPEGEPAFLPLSARSAQAAGPLRAEVSAACERIHHTLLPAFLALVEHPSFEVKASVIKWLASRSEPEAASAVTGALADPDPEVQRTALVALGNKPSPTARLAIGRVLAESPAWPLRLEAARSLGAATAGASPETAQALARAAEHDSVPLVREAALRSLSQLAPEQARPILKRLKASDPEIWVREAAKTLEAALP